MKRAERIKITEERNLEIYNKCLNFPRYENHVWVLDKKVEELAEKYSLKVSTIMRIIYRRYELLRLLDACGAHDNR